MKNPKVSILVPCKFIDDYTVQCIRECNRLDYKNFEIIVLPDEKTSKRFKNTRIIPTGPVKPSRKRNIAVKKTNSDIMAFIDSDAYPDSKWIKNAVPLLSTKGIGIVGGPNLLPKDDSYMKKVSDDILSSKVCTGPFAVRYTSKNDMFVGELPSCNMFVKKEIFNTVKGFDENFLTGEDAKFCFEVAGRGHKIMYSSDVKVYHHRRPVFRPHLRQMWNYGRDKSRLVGSFISRDKILYFMPSIFVIFMAVGLVASMISSPFSSILKLVYSILMLTYLLIIGIASIIKSPSRSILIFPGIVLTHIFYGVGFIYGFFTKKYVSSKK